MSSLLRNFLLTAFPEILADREAMIQRSEDYIHDKPKIRFYALVPSHHRRLPTRWASGHGHETPYYSYEGKYDSYEICPNAPLATWTLSKNIRTAPLWCQPKVLNRLFTPAVFYIGPLGAESIHNALPGVLQGRREEPFIEGIVKGISGLNGKMYTDIITNSIKPITL